MDRQKLFTFYEKIYFHEMETRDKIFTRVQINFALIFTGFSIISYMLRMLDFSVYTGVSIIFAVLAVISMLVSSVGVWYLVSAFWGNEYKCVTNPKNMEIYRLDIEQYAKSIDDYNEQYPENLQPPIDVDEMVSIFVYEQLRDCSSHNTDINDLRFARMHNSIRWLLLASIPFLIASILFISFDLDASSPRKETLIYNGSLVKKLDNLKQITSYNHDLLEGKKICQLLAKKELRLLHQMHHQHQNHEELSKTDNRPKSIEGNMPNKKPTPPPPPPPKKPITRAIMDEAPPKKSS